MKLPTSAFTKKQIAASIEIMEVLSDGDLLCSIVESTKGQANQPAAYWTNAKRESASVYRSKSFARLPASEKSRIVREGAGCLFSKRDVTMAVRIMETLAEQKPNFKSHGSMGTLEWKRIQRDVKTIKSSLQIGAVANTASSSKRTLR